jgi:thiol:disulfide interchange protein DsbD
MRHRSLFNGNGTFTLARGSQLAMTFLLTPLHHALPRGPRIAALLRNALFFIAVCAVWTGAAAQLFSKNPAQPESAGAIVQTEQVRAELVAHAPDGVGAGKPLWLGLQLAHQPHWHTYWKNPGDSGLPTTLQWTLPAGVSAGDIDWPTPKRIPIGNLANFGYEETVLLPVAFTVTPAFQPPASGELEIRLAASWLVCRLECIPQEGTFMLRVPVRGSTAAHGSDFERALQSRPRPLAGAARATVADNALTVSVSGLPAAWHGRALQVFPEPINVAEPVATPQASDAVRSSGTAQQAGTQAWNQGTWSAQLPLSAQRDSSPDALPLVLTLGTQSLRIVAPVSGTWPALTAPATVSPALQAALDRNAQSQAAVARSDSGWGTWGLALAAAVLGGLILNLMPCVLPVLAIKVLGFAQHARHNRASQRLQGLAYTLGVVLSFLALGGLMLGLRASGEQLGWGFQLQSPAVVALLAALFTLISLNLAGVFEVGHLLPHRLASLQARHPMVDAFLSGVLAVAIASPCTAPFMGASLGFAIALPAGQALGIFAALGLGLALPFLAASWVPGLGRWLPRPGAWMNALRRFMAFPMLATVAWLVWIMGHLSGIDGAGSLLVLLLGLGLLVWSLGLQGRSRWVFALISIAVGAALAATIGPNILRQDGGANDAATSAPAGASWQAWAPGRVEAERAAGRAVFVDFTAAWCITCQYNKKTTLANSEVLADMQAHQVTLLRADWTRRDPAITRALEGLGRSGVPVYVLYPPGRPAVVFSEILNPQELRAALAQF